MEINETEYLKKGLTSEQLALRVKNGQINGDPDTPTKSVKEIIFTNTFTFFNLINVIIGVLVLAVGSYKNCLFLGVIFFNTVIGIIQEIRAKKTVDKLSLVSAPRVHVLREGEEREISTSEIALDDLMLLNTGRQICADCIVAEGECEVNESLITGESDPVLKRRGDEMLSGSFVVSGKAKGRVYHTGSENFASKITAGAKYLKKNNSVMLRSLDTIIKVIGVCIIPIAVLLFLNSMFISGQELNNAVVTTAAALIGMIPEGLYLLTSVVMAVSTIRLAMHKTLAQDMYCIETLARVDTLCLDKTGTITEGIMQVEDTEILDGDFPFDKAMTLFTGVMTDDNPTFNAVKRRWGKEESGSDGQENKGQAHTKSNTPKSEKTSKGIDPKIQAKIIPFSSARKWSGAEFEAGSLIFGAPEFVLREGYEKVRERCEKAQNEGLRVLTLAYSQTGFRGNELPEKVTPAALIFIGDVIRKEAPQTLAFFDKQGVDIKIISGDNPVTVSRIAEKAGVKHAEMTVDASTLADKDIPAAAEKYTVFGRVSPNQKLLLVKALQGAGKTVGMTGDGVNDVLALKEADCSIAMQSGSDAARSVSNLVLLDSNFASMPLVVAEGRRSVNNLQRSGTLFLAKTIFSFILALVFIFLPLPYPFQPIQLTLISTLAIGAPSFLLALEPNTDIIKGGFIRNILRRAMPQGAAMALSAIASVVICNALGFDDAVMSAVTVYITAAIAFSTVIRVIKPVKAWKIDMLSVLMGAFICAAVLFPSLFGMPALSVAAAIVVIAVAVVGIGISFFIGGFADSILDMGTKIVGKFKHRYGNKNQ